MMGRTCCVVDTFCEVSTNCRCFKCGEAVCKACSVVVPYDDYGNKRLCHDCLAEEDGNDDRAMGHLYALANSSAIHDARDFFAVQAEEASDECH